MQMTRSVFLTVSTWDDLLIPAGKTKEYKPFHNALVTVTLTLLTLKYFSITKWFVGINL